MKQTLLTGLLLTFAWALSAQVSISFNEDFESYSAGDNLGATSADWEIWPGGSTPANDAQVSDVQAQSGTNSLYLFSSSATWGPADLVLPFGEATFTSGTFDMDMAMFVDAGDGGYFNIQADNPAGTTWAVEIFFNDAGEVNLVSDGVAVGAGNYTQDTWFTVTAAIDIDNNAWVFSIDGVEIANFANNNNRVSSLNLYPVYDEGNASYYIDDIAWTYTDPYPAYDIASVTSTTDGAVDSLDVQCTITGVVYGVDLQGNENVLFTVVDATGGIAVFSDDPNLGYTVTEGDQVAIQGVINEFNCLTQMNPISVSILSTGNGLVTPAVVTALDESTESELVTIEGLTIVDPMQWDNSGASFNVDVTDGTNTYAMRIDDDTDIAGTDVPTTPFILIGLGGQFDNEGACDVGYQILPRYMEDIIPDFSSTEEIGDAKAWALTPNPTTGLVTIQTELELEQLMVFNLFGEVVLISERMNEVDLSGLASGVYMVVGRSQNAVYTQEVVKQ